MTTASGTPLPATHADAAPTIIRLLLHLRLPFNYVLSPLFAWGALASGAAPGWHFLLGLMTFHVLLYGGTNMFNSYYDRDEGPIGGLEHPPPVDRTMFWTSVGLKAVGLLLSLPLGLGFVICYLLFVVYSVTYSHPAIRIKQRPWASAVSVFFGQGLVGFAAGWLAAGGAADAMLRPLSLLAACSAALTVSALYPLTQVYQVAEDAQRGDLTLARQLGQQRVYWYILALLLVGGAGLVTSYAALGFVRSAAVLTVYFVVVGGAIAAIRALQRDLAPRQVYRRVMLVNYTNATVLWLLWGSSLLTRY